MGAFEAASLPYETWCKMGRTSAKVVPGCCVGFFRNEHTRSTPLDPKLTFWCLSNYLGASGTVWLLYKTRCKTGRTSAKVRAVKSRRNFFCNERTRSTPLDPKLLFGCILYYLGAFGAAWLPYKTRCKTGRASVIVHARMSRWNFSQRTHPIHPIGP